MWVVRIDGQNQKAPILDRGFSCECVSCITPLSMAPVVRLPVAPFESTFLVPDVDRSVSYTADT